MSFYMFVNYQNGNIEFEYNFLLTLCSELQKQAVSRIIIDENNKVYSDKCVRIFTLSIRVSQDYES